CVNARRSSMQKLICGLILAATLSSGAQDSKNATAQPITWIFLNTGASRDKTKSMAKEAVAKMQSEHVGNFGKLFDQGRLFAAGPLGDNGFIRGTVILDAQTSEQVRDSFKTDPLVQNDILKVEGHS